MEFLTLLLIAAAATTLLGLLIAGFVYVPWLVALVLIGLLFALTRVSLPQAESIDPTDTNAIDPTAIAAADKQQEPMEFTVYQVIRATPDSESDSTVTPIEPEHHEPVLSYRGAKYSM